MFLDDFLAITAIAHAFQGIKIAVGILILDAAVKMLKKMPQKTMPRMIMGAAAAAMLAINIFSLRISSIVVMLTAGLVSLILYLTKKGGQAK
jgi:chromate transporter